ncbi:MAG TPA: N-acyl homoserine lactonase family protein [Acidimicrobiales bacterium]|nr:N-acyl homoserine lactonase family protein [Acidimicrobiales bacterium]
MTAGPGVLRVVLLTLGWAEVPKSVSVHGASSAERLREPVPGVLVEVDSGWILLDTGYNPALIRDPLLRSRYHDRFSEVVPILPPGTDDALLEALAVEGLDVDAVSSVGLSHLHYDHAGGLRHFTRGCPVHLQRDELSFGLSDDAADHGIFAIDFDDPAIAWELADGDTDIAPGVTAVKTAGHTPGHQSFVVRYDPSLGGGGFVFAFDAADLTENIQGELPIGSTVDCAPEETVEQIRRLKEIAAREHLRLVPGHDPNVWPRLTKDLHAVGGVPQTQ